MKLQDYFSATGVSQVAFAKEIGVSVVMVNQWKTGARQVPASRCPDIERATSGVVTCEELRPDVNWAYLRGTASKMRNVSNDEMNLKAMPGDDRKKEHE